MNASNELRYMMRTLLLLLMCIIFFLSLLLTKQVNIGIIEIVGDKDWV
jgi:hypothetical protein